MIRTPWWVLVALYAAGVGTALLWPAPSDVATDELRERAEAAEVNAQLWRGRFQGQSAVNDTLLEAHARETVRSVRRIEALEDSVQAQTARAAALADSIRLRVDSATARLLDDLESAHADALAAEREKTEAWRTRALSAEAGWRDARLALVTAYEALEAAQNAHQAQAGLVRALESQVARANREKRILALAGIAGVAWGLTK